VDAHSPFTKRLIMTPKDKAKELVDKFTVVGLQQRNEGIQCAVIAVDEIIESIPEEPSISTVQRIGSIMFWFEVKKEIELL
jgi:hypothetical protein